MGYRINNEPLLMDIAKTPHALIAGATGQVNQFVSIVY